LPHHPITTLSAGQINGADTLTVELMQPADMPIVIMVRWPAAPTITTPGKLNETAATVMRILANAVTAYTQIKAAKRR
jgi:hypothetical protein